MSILYAGLVLGAIGLIFGLVLTFAAKAFHVDVDERVEQVRECLAGANCGACGYPGCDGFAKAVVEGKAAVTGCTPAGNEGAKKIAAIMGVEAADTERKVARVLCQGVKGEAKEKYAYDGYQSCRVAAGLAGGPKLCRFSCIGFGDCADKCNFNAITMVDGIAHIDEDHCVGCGACVADCPTDAISERNGAYVVDEGMCIDCGACGDNCPVGAITPAE